jgi:nucleoside-diphosphate-sugar epimerase
LVGESHWHVGISCNKLCQELGYQPTVTLHEGMRRAVEWCKAHGKL